MQKAKGPDKKEPSVTKTLISLIQSDPSNRTCADCRSALLDPSTVYASFCPSVEEIQNVDDHPEVAIAFHDFLLTHRAFAPPEVRRDASRLADDPANTVNQRFGGHGLFICLKCSEAHRILGAPITKVNPVQDASAWTAEEARFMRTSGGNLRSWTVYEKFMPETWKRKRPKPDTLLVDRIIFCKAKYQALAFAMPPPGPLSELAWLSILERNQTAQRFKSGDLRKIHTLVPSSSINPTKTRNSIDDAPNRLIDYFCVVSSSMQLHPKERDLTKSEGPEDIKFWPHTADCYPSQDAHSDTIFPDQLPSFVLPNGCSPSRTQQAPTFYTFVLTLGDGDRLYGGALKIYDEHQEIEEVKEAILKSGYKGKMPNFLSDEDEASDVVFFPKCLVLLSHHPYFDLFRESLLQIYRITLVEAPLPIERYISNLVSEVPLPPHGKVRVEFGFTTQKPICIERPPINKLPMANFSFRPMFASLSVTNILVVLGCLMEECKVALLSQHYSMLTPVCEAFLSALFPFEWQGLYIPMMPYSMVELMDAPVPFLVGLDSKYLHETPTKQRPKDVVFVDLDRDVIYLGFDEVTGARRSISCLPSRDAMKLRDALEEAGGSMYLLPNSGIKGCIMEGSNKLLLVPNDKRPKYALMQTMTLDEGSLYRQDIIDKTKNAFDEDDLFEQIEGFRSVHGQMKDRDDTISVDSSLAEGSKSAQKVRRPKFLRNRNSDSLSTSSTARDQAHLLDMNDPDGFSPKDIRNAFLRFMVAIFANYEKFIVKGKLSDSFDVRRFIADLGAEQAAAPFLRCVLETQMFQRFLEERKENPDHPEIRFFDESILAKLNRSKVTKMAKGGKLPTPFLDDESGKITKTYTPPPPSNLGLPDSTEGYQYKHFPIIDLSKIGRLRPPIVLDDKNNLSTRSRPLKNAEVRRKQGDLVKRAMKPLLANGAIATMALRGAKDLESALLALKDRHRQISKKKRTELLKYNPSQLNETSKEGTIEKKESDRMVTILTRADTIMINARRKQSILLDLVIKLQATCRMGIKRRAFLSILKAVICLQRRFRSTPLPEVDADKQRYELMYMLSNERNGRRYVQYNQLKKIKKSALSIQSVFRQRIALRSYTRTRAGFIAIQKQFRGRRARFIIAKLNATVSKVQAQVRGMQIRKHINQLFRLKMSLYREQIVTLWQIGNASLSLRTKFWPTFSSGEGFARVRLAEAELHRMWGLLGWAFDSRHPDLADDATRIGQSLGIDSTTYCMCQQSISNIHIEITPESLPPESRKTYELQEAERQQVHDRLDAIASESDLARIYESFGIPPKEKRKKIAVAGSIWSNYDIATASESAMMALFPELQGSLNIIFQSPSAKAKRRFPDAKVADSLLLDKDTWERISLEGIIKRHVKEVTSLYITKVPSLMAKLDELNRGNNCQMRHNLFEDAGSATDVTASIVRGILDS